MQAACCTAVWQGFSGGASTSRSVILQAVCCCVGLAGGHVWQPSRMGLLAHLLRLAELCEAAWG